MNNEFSELISNAFRNIYLWGKESIVRSIFIIFLILVLGVPFLKYLQKLVSEFSYLEVFNLIISFFQNNFTTQLYIIAALFLLCGILFYLVYREIQKSKVITENFNGNLNAWSIPLNAGWTIQKIPDTLGRVLSVTNSSLPGILKGAQSWYDYEISFQAKIDKDVTDKQNPNFCVVVRSENNLNGVMLQFTKTYLRPHLIYNGTFIIDQQNIERLPTILKSDEWVKIKIVVRGSNIEVFIYNFKLQYKIPTLVYKAENFLLRMTLLLEDVKKSNDDIEEKETKASELFQEYYDLLSKKNTDKEKETTAYKKYTDAREQVPAYTKIVLEFQKGSVGFRESGGEHAYFRNLKVARL